MLFTFLFSAEIPLYPIRDINHLRTVLCEWPVQGPQKNEERERILNGLFEESPTAIEEGFNFVNFEILNHRIQHVNMRDDSHAEINDLISETPHAFLAEKNKAILATALFNKMTDPNTKKFFPNFDQSLHERTMRKIHELETIDSLMAIIQHTYALSPKLHDLTFHRILDRCLTKGLELGHDRELMVAQIEAFKPTETTSALPTSNPAGIVKGNQSSRIPEAPRTEKGRHGTSQDGRCTDNQDNIHRYIGKFCQTTEISDFEQLAVEISDLPEESKNMIFRQIRQMGYSSAIFANITNLAANLDSLILRQLIRFASESQELSLRTEHYKKLQPQIYKQLSSSDLTASNAHNIRNILSASIIGDPLLLPEHKQALIMLLESQSTPSNTDVGKDVGKQDESKHRIQRSRTSLDSRKLPPTTNIMLPQISSLRSPPQVHNAWLSPYEALQERILDGKEALETLVNAIVDSDCTEGEKQTLLELLGL